MGPISIMRVTADDARVVCDLVQRLLVELGEEGDETGVLDGQVLREAWRPGGVGALLIEAVKALGRERGWRRVDVTAPESEPWARTRRFYERQGFTFAGPKLKCLL